MNMVKSGRVAWRGLLCASATLTLLLALTAAEFQPPLKTTDGFAVPQPGPRFTFPRDHGSHPDFKIEWWYVTGHLFGEQGQRFGFQATFFRQAGPLSTNQPAPNSVLFGNHDLH